MIKLTIIFWILWVVYLYITKAIITSLSNEEKIIMQFSPEHMPKKVLISILLLVLFTIINIILTIITIINF